FQAHVLREHARILGLDCLPRLIAGHRVPGLQADPDPSSLSGPGPSGTKPDGHPLALANTVGGLILFLIAIGALVAPAKPPRDAASVAVRWGLVLSAIATVCGFLLNRNIFNSDN